MAEQLEHADSRRLYCGGSGAWTAIELYDCWHTPATDRGTVLARILFLRRRFHLLTLRQEWLRRPHQLCRLDPRDLLGAGHAGHQLDREKSTQWRQLLFGFRFRSGVEG